MSLSFRSVHSSFSAVSRRISCSGRAMGQRNREYAEYPRHVYGSALSTFTYGAVSAAVRRKCTMEHCMPAQILTLRCTLHVMLRLACRLLHVACCCVACCALHVAALHCRLLLRCTVVCCCVALSAFACRYASCTSAQICVRSASAFSTRTLTYLPGAGAGAGAGAVPPISRQAGLG